MRVHHIAIQVADLAAMSAFYRDLLGLTETKAARDGVTWFTAGEIILMLEPVNGAIRDEVFASSTPGLHVVSFGIDVATRDAWKEKFATRPILLERETPYSLFIRDPEGNRIGLTHFPVAETPNR